MNRSADGIHDRRGGLQPLRRTGTADSVGRVRRGSDAVRVAFFAGPLLAVLSGLGGCQSVDHPVKLPVSYETRSEQLLVLSDFKLPQNHELIRELGTLREQVAKTLSLPVKRDTVVVYLSNNEAEYRRYMNTNFPRLPPRSAYFVANSTELAVYTHWGANVREDLRHEFTHGILHSAMKHVPLWLDEGLAEYFEVAGPKPGGINQDYAKHLSEALATSWRPDLQRLENLDESASMARADYQESWAWVHFLLNGAPEGHSVLLGYLADLRTVATPKPISQRLRHAIPDFEERFAGYVSKLTTGPQAISSL